jgi:hypothetical protein
MCVGTIVMLYGGGIGVEEGGGGRGGKEGGMVGGRGELNRPVHLKNETFSTLRWDRPVVCLDIDRPVCDEQVHFWYV